MYRKMGFTSIVCLQEWQKKKPKLGGVPGFMGMMMEDYDNPKYIPSDLRKAGLELFHIPVEDMKPPTKEQFDRFITYVDNPERIVLAHCFAGIGRTGCMLAAYYGVKNQISGRETIKAMREIWQPYIQTYEQEDGVCDYINSRLSI